MKVHASALKHGTSAEDAAQAAEWSLWIEPLDDDGPPQRELLLDLRFPLLRPQNQP